MRPTACHWIEAVRAAQKNGFTLRRGDAEVIRLMPMIRFFSGLTVNDRRYRMIGCTARIPPRLSVNPFF